MATNVKITIEHDGKVSNREVMHAVTQLMTDVQPTAEYLSHNPVSDVHSLITVTDTTWFECGNERHFTVEKQEATQ